MPHTRLHEDTVRAYETHYFTQDKYTGEEKHSKFGNQDDIDQSHKQPMPLFFLSLLISRVQMSVSNNCHSFLPGQAQFCADDWRSIVTRE